MKRIIGLLAVFAMAALVNPGFAQDQAKQTPGTTNVQQDGNKGKSHRIPKKRQGRPGKKSPKKADANKQKTQK